VLTAEPYRILSATAIEGVPKKRNCFSGFNQTTIVLHYSAHIKPREMIKTIKTENITHKHNLTLIALSQSIAVNK